MVNGAFQDNLKKPFLNRNYKIIKSNHSLKDELATGDFRING